MGSLTSSGGQQTSSATSTSCIITIEDVGKGELEQYKRKLSDIDLALQSKRRELGRDLEADEKVEVLRRVDAVEKAGRGEANPITFINSAGVPEPIDLSELPWSYHQIRNLQWIESQPVYKAALEDWRRNEAILAARVERKSKRSGVLNNEIYNIIGFYSVFQGVLLTATSQSNYLHCQNVFLAILLSGFASVCCLLGIQNKFSGIFALEKTISSDNSTLKEVKARISALERRGERFRFYDYRESKVHSSQSNPTTVKFWGFSSQLVVLLAIGLFSLLFVASHPLILCHPGPK